MDSDLSENEYIDSNDDYGSEMEEDDRNCNRRLKDTVSDRQKKNRLADLEDDLDNESMVSEESVCNMQQANTELDPECEIIETQDYLSEREFDEDVFQDPLEDDIQGIFFYQSKEEDVEESDFDDASSMSSYYSIGADSDFDEMTGEFNPYNEIDDEEEEEKRQSWFQDRFIDIMFVFNFPKTGINMLLNLLLSKNLPKSFDFLPRSYKTLLKTPRKLILHTMSPGKYFHCGFRQGLATSLDKLQLPIEALDNIQVFINVDGTPVSKSSQSDLWPILGRIYTPVLGDPFEIGVYQGKGKPADFNEFLSRCVDEAKDLVDDGLVYNGKKVSVEVKFVADAPALASLKYIKHFSGHFSCTKCETQGEYIHNEGKAGGRVTFPELDAPLRNHQSFNNQSQKDHHAGVPEQLMRIPNIDMIKSFTIDPMHCAYIGVMRKLLSVWTSSRKSMKVRLTKSCMTTVSTILEGAAKFIPSDFSRKTRSLDDLSRYKATELRLLLLYVLPVVTVVMPEEIHQHFLLLHCALRILACPESASNTDSVEHARILIKTFIESSKTIYGDAFISWNVHNLIHLPDEVLEFGSVDLFSCFSFENRLQKLNNMLRPGRNALSQLANRIMERRANPSVPQSQNSTTTHRFQAIKEHNRPLGAFLKFIGRLRVIKQYESIVYLKFRLSINSPNNCVTLKNGDSVVIENFIRTEENKMFIVGRKFLSNDSLYNYPMDSRLLGISSVWDLGELQCWPIEEIRCKAMKIPIPRTVLSLIQKYAFVDLLHSESEISELF